MVKGRVATVELCLMPEVKVVAMEMGQQRITMPHPLQRNAGPKRYAHNVDLSG